MESTTNQRQEYCKYLYKFGRKPCQEYDIGEQPTVFEGFGNEWKVISADQVLVWRLSIQYLT